jgi:hypothetical protein
VVPAPGRDTYQEKAAMSLQAAAGHAATVQLILTQSLNGQILEGYADQTVSETEDSLSSVQDQFASMQPPSGDASDALRDTTTSLLSDTADAVEAGRIALRRSDRAAMSAAVRQLIAMGEKLDAAEQAAS